MFDHYWIVNEAGIMIEVANGVGIEDNRIYKIEKSKSNKHFAFRISSRGFIDGEFDVHFKKPF